MPPRHPGHAVWFAALVFLCSGALATAQSTRAAEANRNVTRAAATATPSLAQLRRHAGEIDRLIEADLKKHALKPNADADDATFLRRVYLDAVGRIPSYEEAKAFLESRDREKRRKLIDALVGSAGWNSRQFNYWADILRLQSRLRGISGETYIDWVKTAVADNMPYDRFVYDMLTSTGHIYDNGAAGYYMRDDGMPLDNMANTVQIFLGTQLACAQCHDHPFDKWTQHEFYEMAAYTYGVQTRYRGNREFQAKFRELNKLQKSGDIKPQTRQALRNLLRPVRYAVSDNARRTIKLPKDYKYDDAKPGDSIEPHTLFGKSAEVSDQATRREAYAEWMTSPDNPRFTTVIANRYWKQVFGRALIEPIDDMRDDTLPSNPALMAYLESMMKSLNYDLQAYAKVLYNTKAYQRQVNPKEPDIAKPYHFEGPVLRRMSAEEMWDSMLTLAMPDPDERENPREGRYGNYAGKAQMEALEKMTPQEIVDYAEKLAEARRRRPQMAKQYRKLQSQMQNAMRKGDREKLAELRQTMQELRKNRDSMMAMPGAMADDRGDGKRMELSASRWKGFPATLVRASELQHPAPNGHFLQQFGQSDRQTIEAANTEATVTQILTLLNGPIYAQLGLPHSVLRQNLEKAAGDPRRMAEVIVVSILSRQPTASEASLIAAELKADGKEGASNVVWALLNTRRFAFVQ